MSKINLTGLEDPQMTDKLLSLWVSAYQAAAGKLPDAIVVTLEQAKKFFFSAGEISTNYNGIPLEVQQAIPGVETAEIVLDNIITHLHRHEISAMAGVYRVLEEAKQSLREPKQNV